MAYSKNRRLAEIVSDTSGNLSVEGIIVPTQSNSDNDTSAASTAFVHAHVNALVDSAPGTLNTLNEIAAALNDDANFNTTVTNAIAAKLPLSGGTLSGNLVMGDNNITGINKLEILDSADNNRLEISGNAANGFIFDMGGTGSAGTINFNDFQVGIGTSAPDANLHVLKATAGSITNYANNVLVLENNTDLGLSLLTPNGAAGHLMFGSPGHQYHSYIRGEYGSSSSSTLKFYTDQVNTMTHKAGKVGIGTASPGSLLELKATTSSSGYGEYPALTIRNDNAAGYGAIHFNEGSTQRARVEVGNNSGSPYLLMNTGTASGNGIYIDSSGKVGIGTITPDHPLEAVGAISSADSGLQKATFANVGNDLVLTANAGQTNVSSVILFKSSQSGGAAAERMRIDSLGNVGIGEDSIGQISSGATTLAIKGTSNGKGGALRFLSANDSISAYIYPDTTGLSINTNSSSSGDRNDIYFRTSAVERMRIDTEGYVTLTSTRSEYALELNSASNRSGLVLNKPGTSSIMGSVLMIESDETFRLGTASYYHVRMAQNGSTYLGNTGSNTHFSSSGNLYLGTTTNFIAYNTLPGSQWTTIAESIGYGSQSYNTSQRYWHHLKSAGGTHITINTDSAVTAAENSFDDFVVWQGTQDSGEPLFRVSNVGRVIAKQNYEIGNHKTNKEEFGVNAINTVDTATSDINTTTTNTYENRSGVYWLNFNSKRFRAYVKPNWLQQRNWVLAAKFFSHDDMPAGSSLWTNDASWNGGDFDLNNGHFAKYGNIWRYFGFNRLAMQMGNRVAPIMQFSSTQTLYGAFSGGLANNAGVTANSTDPSLGTSTTLTYHTMTNFIGPNFVDVSGAEDRMQPYGLNKWLGVSINSNSSNNQGSGNLNSNVSKGFQTTVEDNHPVIGGIDSNSRAGAWIGCAMDEGASNQANATGIAGADSAFGFGGACGNNARTWTSGYAEWAKGNEVVNLLPGYIWLSID